MSYQDQLVQPEERVLSTLEADGKRRWLHPRLSKGQLWVKRRIVAYALIAFFNALPFIYLNGKPAILLNLPDREFTFFGKTFLPTDTVLLALFMLIVFVSVFLATALFGRVWCGWACPQTVYLEFVYRPIERVFKGKAGVGGKPKKVAAWRTAAMYLCFLLISFHLANIFLAYFVSAKTVYAWSLQPPWAHPTGFALVTFVTVGMMFDFAYWREQLCIIGCPYGRFQSVMLDRNSLIVSYDPARGEPRGKATKKAQSDVALPQLGDCVDCTMCVQVCPTGIDIRDGLQLECVNCTQCIDACDAVMTKLGRDPGLIRYSSQARIDGERPRLLRPRVVIYPLILCVLITLFIFALAATSGFDAEVLRNRTQSFTYADDGRVRNTFTITLTNRTDAPQSYTIALAELPPELSNAELLTSRDTLELEPGESVTEPVHILAEPDAFLAHRGKLHLTFHLADSQGDTQTAEVMLLGPRAQPQHTE